VKIRKNTRNKEKKEKREKQRRESPERSREGGRKTKLEENQIFEGENTSLARHTLVCRERAVCRYDQSSES
jgi:hypothetical protein